MKDEVVFVEEKIAPAAVVVAEAEVLVEVVETEPEEGAQ